MNYLPSSRITKQANPDPSPNGDKSKTQSKSMSHDMGGSSWFGSWIWYNALYCSKLYNRLSLTYSPGVSVLRASLGGVGQGLGTSPVTGGFGSSGLPRELNTLLLGLQCRTLSTQNVMDLRFQGCFRVRN